MKKVLILFAFAIFASVALYTPARSDAAVTVNFVLPRAVKVRVSTNLDTVSHKLNMMFSNILFAKSVHYELTYKHGGISEGVSGTILTPGIFPIKRSVLLGTCSAGGTCVYHENLSDMKLKVTTNYSLFNKTETETFTIL